VDLSEKGSNTDDRVAAFSFFLKSLLTFATISNKSTPPLSDQGG